MLLTTAIRGQAKNLIDIQTKTELVISVRAIFKRYRICIAKNLIINLGPWTLKSWVVGRKGPKEEGDMVRR